MKIMGRLAVTALLALPLSATAVDEPEVLSPVTVTVRVPLEKTAVYELHEGRYGAAAVSLGDYIYIIGGSNDSATPLDSIERFDPRTGRSEPFGRLQVARRHHRAVVVAGKIYVLGGASYLPVGPEDAEGHAIVDAAAGSSGFVEEMTRVEKVETAGNFMRTPARSALNPLEHTVEVIDPVARTVTFAPAMPIAKARFSCAVVEGKIYVLGGLQVRGNRQVSTNSTEVLDPVSGQWSAGINMPASRLSTAAAVGDFIVIAGGYRLNSDLAEVDSYFPAGKVWRRLPALHEPINPGAVVFFGHELYLFGAEGAADRIITYDLVKKVSRAFPLPYERAQHAAMVVHAGRIYMLGGTDHLGRTALRSVQVFSPPRAPDERG